MDALNQVVASFYAIYLSTYQANKIQTFCKKCYESWICKVHVQQVTSCLEAFKNNPTDVSKSKILSIFT